MNGAPTRPRSSDSRSWEARPGAARAVRALVLLGPVSAGAVASVVASRALPVAHSTPVVLARTLGVIAVAMAVVWAVDRYARKLLPLAALLRLSLIFPDHAPSRFRSALKSGSSRRMSRVIEETRANGLATDPGDAARQVVQLIGTIGDHDRRTRGHSERVRLFADLVGEELNLSKEERQKLQWGALLHDLGKLMVPAEILNKAGRPSPEEWKVLEGHPEAGMTLIEPLRDFLGEWVGAIGGHHEKWDGSGYPNRLRADEIPRAAAIVAVADSFEVMTAIRSYKKAMPLSEARAELTRCAGAHFSPEVVRAFLSISLGQLRLATGPLAALAHLPFLGSVMQLPAAAASAVPAFASGVVAVPVAAAVMATTLVVASPPMPTPRELAAVSVAGADVRRSTPAGATGRSDSDPTAGTDGNASPDRSAGGDGSSPPAVEATSSSSGADLVTTTTVGTGREQIAGSLPSPAESVADSSSTTTSTPTEHGGGGTVSPITTPRATTTTTTAPPTTTTAVPATVVSQLTVMVSRNADRSNARPLEGATLPIGALVYVYSVTTHQSVEYEYPGGSASSSTSPFVISFRVPLTPGSYRVSAHATGHGSSTDATPRFTVALLVL